MSGSSESMQLIAGLVTHMRQIVGEGACYAMLHYGALEEGKRLGAAGHDLKAALARIDEALSQTSEVLADEGDHVVVRVHASPLADTGQRALQGIILGLVEGTVTATRKARFTGSLRPGRERGELLLDLHREG